MGEGEAHKLREWGQLARHGAGVSSVAPGVGISLLPATETLYPGISSAESAGSPRLPMQLTVISRAWPHWQQGRFVS